MKIKRILLTGVSVLAISSLSNCFLTGWLGEALNPIGSVSGAKAREIIQNAASSGYSYGGLTYTSSRTKSQKTIDDLSVGTQGQDNEPIPGFAQRQTAFVQQIAKLAANIDPGHNYTAASVKNCAGEVQSMSYAVALNKIEAADTKTSNCIAAVESFADLKFAGVLVGSCYNYNGTAFSAPAALAGGAVNSGTTCLACVATVQDSTGSTTGTSFWNTTMATGSTTESADTATNIMIPWVNIMRTSMLGFADKASSSGGNTMENNKDACMELYMAAVSAGASLAKCGKTASGGITEATTLTGFVGSTACELEKTGEIVSTPWLNF